MNSELSKALKLIQKHTIGYKTYHKRMCDSIAGGLLLSQIIWNITDKYGKDKVNITNDELRDQLAFSEQELRTAKSKLKRVRGLTISYEGIPRKTYYEIDWNVYLEEIANITNNEEIQLIIYNEVEIERIDELNIKEYTKQLKKENKGKELCNWNGKLIAMTKEGKLYEKNTAKSRTLKTVEAQEVIGKLFQKNKMKMLQEINMSRLIDNTKV